MWLVAAQMRSSFSQKRYFLRCRHLLSLFTQVLRQLLLIRYRLSFQSLATIWSRNLWTSSYEICPCKPSASCEPSFPSLTSHTPFPASPNLSSSLLDHVCYILILSLQSRWLRVRLNEPELQVQILAVSPMRGVKLQWCGRSAELTCFCFFYFLSSSNPY